MHRKFSPTVYTGWAKTFLKHSQKKKGRYVQSSRGSVSLTNTEHFTVNVEAAEFVINNALSLNLRPGYTTRTSTQGNMLRKAPSRNTGHTEFIH